MVLVFCHSDADGYASAEIVRMALGANNNCRIVPTNYNQPVKWDRLRYGDKIYVVDMTFDDVTMDRLNRDYDLTWIDHHGNIVQAALDRNFVPKGLRSADHAACELTWTYMFPNREIPQSVKLIGDHDTWKHVIPDSEAFCDGLDVFNIRPSNQNDAFWDLLLNDNTELLTRIHRYGKEIYTFKSLTYDLISKDLTYTFDTYIDTPERKYTVLAGNCRGNSTVFKSVADIKQHDFMLYYGWIGTVNKYRCGVYNVEGHDGQLDVSQYARLNDGDGHHDAAGFSCERLPKTRVLKNDQLVTTHMLQGKVEGAIELPPTHYDPIKEYTDKNNLAAKQFYNQLRLSFLSGRFNTTFAGLNIVACNYPLPFYELFIWQELLLQHAFVSYVWTNCGKYRIVVHPVNNMDLSAVLKQYNPQRYGNAWWFFSETLPWESPS